MKPLKIGVLGVANIAQRSVIPAIQALPEHFELCSIASRTADKAQQAADHFQTTAFPSYQSLIDHPDLDAIYIPLPNSMHAEWVTAALERGLHVLVEKSLACTLQEANTLNQLAQQKQLALVETFQFQHHPQLTKIKELVEQGAIGELRCLRSSFGFPPFPDDDNIRYQKALGGGGLLDAGAYPIKIAQIFLGHDLEVNAANLWIDPDKQVDIWGGAHLSQKQGPHFAEIAFGFDHQYQCSLELWGSKGRLTTDRIFTAPPNFEARIELQSGMEKQTITVPAANHFCNMLLHFHKLVDNTNCRTDEYHANLTQARLVSEVFAKAKSNA